MTVLFLLMTGYRGLRAEGPAGEGGRQAGGAAAAPGGTGRRAQAVEPLLPVGARRGHRRAARYQPLYATSTRALAHLIRVSLFVKSPKGFHSEVLSRFIESISQTIVAQREFSQTGNWASKLYTFWPYDHLAPTK